MRDNVPIFLVALPPARPEHSRAGGCVAARRCAHVPCRTWACGRGGRPNVGLSVDSNKGTEISSGFVNELMTLCGRFY